MKSYIRKQLIIASCVYLGQITCGYNIGWVSNVIIKLQDPEQTPLAEAITNTQASWISSLAYVGLMGSSAAGYLSNTRGRKPCFVLGGIITMGSYLLMSLANNLEMIYAGRALIGLPSGSIFIISLVYIAEISSKNIRGILLTSTSIFYAFGVLLAYSVGPFVSYAVTGYVAIALSVVFTTGSFFLPESPTYYVLQGQEDKARDVLISLGREDDVKDILSTKVKEPIGILQAWREIFTVKSNRKTMFITTTLMILQQLSGIVVVLFFATSIFELTGSSLKAHISTIIIGVTQLVASSITPVFIDRCGRKVLLIASTSICCVCLVLLGYYFFLNDTDHSGISRIQWLPVVSLVVFIAAYNFGLCTVPGMLTGELFDSNVRGPGSVLIFCVGWMVGFVVVTTYGYMLTALGAHIIFWMYSAFCAVATVFTIFFVPETKGKSLEEIQVFEEQLNQLQKKVI